VRANQSHWGTASDGHAWGGDAATNAAFSIAGNAGVVSNTAGSFSATLGPMASDAEVLFTGSVSSFANTNIGALLRYQDGKDWYRAYLTGSALVVQKRIAGAYTTLGSAPFSAAASTAYTLRFRAVGTTLVARAWASSSAEPSAWMVTVTDASLSSGLCGLRMLDKRGVSVSYTSFIATANPALTGAVVAAPPFPVWPLPVGAVLVYLMYMKVRFRTSRLSSA